MRQIILDRIEFYKTVDYYRFKIFGPQGMWAYNFDFSSLNDKDLIEAFEKIVSTMRVGI